MRAARCFFAMTLVFATGIASASPASSAVPAWSVAPSVSPPGMPTGAFAAVACATETRCFAFGRSHNDQLIEQWDGVRWSILPAVPATAGAQLNDIACASATRCLAVGLLGSQVLVEQWDGTSWSVAATPTLAGSTALWSVACPSAVSCFAAGRADNQVLIEQWDGSTWSVSPTPPAPSTYGLGVGCSSPSDCSGVGVIFTGGNARPFIEHWNGSAWSIVASPTSPAGVLRSLNSVACASSTACFAVGANGAKAMIERWNGSTWTDVAGVTGSTGFADVSCPSATTCFAVGDVVERWNGTTWSVVPSPKGQGFAAISCLSSVSCYAVGNATIERWNGASWAIVTHPLPMPSESTLAAVSCAAPAPCFAVGQRVTKTGTLQTLIERRTASSWVVSASPNAPGATENGLAAVSCRSLSFCIAVGGSSTTTKSKTLIERWNGKKWVIVPSPNHGSDASGLTGVSCTSAKVCFAVGNFTHGSWRQTLVERWNGTKWSIVASPSRPKGSHVLRYNELKSVSCMSKSNCLAVGEDTTDVTRNAKSSTLTERWNGTKWSIVASPNPGKDFNRLVSVSCVSAVNCYAAGGSITRFASTEASSLIAHWNGNAWSRVKGVDRASAQSSELTGISCPSATNCRAVGKDFIGSNGAMIVKTRTASGWSTVALAPPVGTLNGISCTSASRCFAVGDVGAPGAIRNTLVEQYS
jgi:hypothetical protein